MKIGMPLRRSVRTAVSAPRGSIVTLARCSVRRQRKSRRSLIAQSW